jgi:hypothetical protein
VRWRWGEDCRSRPAQAKKTPSQSIKAEKLGMVACTCYPSYMYMGSINRKGLVQVGLAKTWAPIPKIPKRTLPTPQKKEYKNVPEEIMLRVKEKHEKHGALKPV